MFGIVIYAIVSCIFQVAFVNADYECLCNYNVEIPVFSKASSTGQVIGYLYEFDCKAIYANSAKDSKFQPVQFENQVGYIENGNGSSSNLPGKSVPTDDLVKTTTVSVESTTSTTTEAATIANQQTNKTTPMPMVTDNLTSTVKGTTIQVPTISIQNRTVTSSSQPTGAVVVVANGNITVLTHQSSDNTTHDNSTTHSTFSSNVTSTSATIFSTIPVSSTSNMPITTSQAARTSSTTIPMQPFMANTTSTPISTASTTTTPPPSTTRVTMMTPTTPTTTFTTTMPITTSTTTTPTTTTPTTTFTTTTKRVTTTAPKPSCPNGWIMYQTSCYLLHTNNRVHWGDANCDCVSKSSHLTIIETADEFNFLKQQLTHHINIHNGDDSETSAWVAGRDDRIEGHWEWYDGFTNTYKPFTYTHWGQDEPDAGEGEHEEDCMTMVGEKGFIWADYSCNENMYYVCEQSALPLINVQTQQTQNPPQQTQSPPKQTSAASCPSGWIMNHGSCYFFHTDDRYKWRNANSFCSAHQAHLAIIETAEEDHFLKQQSSQRIHEHGDSDSGVWVGGSDDDHEGHWEWVDGFSHTNRPMQGYTNWYPGEPDSGDGEHGEDCMCMIGEKGFQWQDYHCGKHMFFICEKSTTFAAPLVG
ncbi:aggrecan core protein-like [Mercenaria mercenaria]|uniref:aggrecan core protein-like n=1 Tax=Mercenaria mercenaria TaxID=6596 RepID=UPI00234F4293|nr:aggrecan core protein-like [Mercenaria mercenaria]